MKIIESVTIRYFRSVYTLTLNECEDLTVITGKNDVGKSNILKALNLFFCQKSDYNIDFNFADDYSLVRKEEVKRDTIRGQQFISITIKFSRGSRMPNSLPPFFSVTKRWDMHSMDCKISSDVHTKMQQYSKKKNIKYSEKITTSALSSFLNRIKYIYIPAIKDENVFNKTLDILQQSLFSKKHREILDVPINKANNAIQTIINTLQMDFKQATNIESLVQLPNTLNYTDGLLQINTEAPGGSVTITKRGDGIRTHYIPKILDYVAKNSNDIFVWGFEEPENSYEYRRCIQVAEEFENQYCNSSQIFITSHSPAFFTENVTKKKIYRVYSNNGRTELMKNNVALDEELGYIELYKDFIHRVKELQREQEEKDLQIRKLHEEIRKISTPLILTEGKTDAQLLKIAIEKLNLNQFRNYRIHPIISGENRNNTALKRHLEELRDNMQPSCPIIGMFDRDTDIAFQCDEKTLDLRKEKYIKLKNNIYAFAIPVPHNRAECNEISIEHYFTDKELRTECNGKRLFLGNEFYSTGVYKGDEDFFYKGSNKTTDTIKIIEHETRAFVTRGNGTGDYSISKARFVQCIEEGRDGFKNISFDEFRLIFDIIDEIVSPLQNIMVP